MERVLLTRLAIVFSSAVSLLYEYSFMLVLEVRKDLGFLGLFSDDDVALYTIVC